MTVWNSEYHSALQWRHDERDGVSNNQPYHCLLERLFRCRSKKTSELRVTGLCAGNLPVTGEFPTQMASNAENVSMWWRHHDPNADQGQKPNANMGFFLLHTYNANTATTTSNFLPQWMLMVLVCSFTMLHIELNTIKYYLIDKAYQNVENYSTMSCQLFAISTATENMSTRMANVCHKAISISSKQNYSQSKIHFATWNTNELHIHTYWWHWTGSVRLCWSHVFHIS